LRYWILTIRRGAVSVATRPVPYYTRWGLYPQALFVVGCWFCMHWWPIIPGVSIGFLALAAVIMAVRADNFTGAEKAVWVALGMVLCFVELRTIYGDRDEHDRLQSEIRRQDNEHFEKIVGDLEMSEKHREEEFTSTLARSDALMLAAAKIMGLSEESAGNLTGGDSFVYFRFFPSGNPNVTNVLATHHGRYMIANVGARIVDMDKFRAAIPSHDPKALSAADVTSMKLPALNPNSLTSMRMGYSLSGTDHHNFTVFFSNGYKSWTEDLRERYVNGAWSCAIRVIQEQPGKKLQYFYQVDDAYPEKQSTINWNQ